MPAPEIVARPAHLPAHDQLGEEPWWDAATEALWWVDTVGKRVNRLDPASGEVRSWVTPQFVSSAVPCDSGGLVLGLVDGLHRLDLGSGLTRPFARPDDDARNRSNEMRPDPWGRLWLGTMWNNIGPHGEDRPVGADTGGLFCVEPDGRSTRLLSGIGISNTLVWSPDDTRLYFGDTKAGVMWSFACAPDRPELSDRRVFMDKDIAPGEADGSAMDEEGCVWTARWGGSCVIRVTPDGRVDRTLDVPARQPSCVAFGGPDRKTLYITSARQGLDAPGDLDGALFVTSVDVAGRPVRRFAA